MVASTRVLVVDDEPSVRRIAQRVFSRDGIEAVLAADGDEGLELLLNTEFDLVLLDSSMPKMSGREVLEAMRERGSPTPVILSSGYGENDVPTQAEFPNLFGFLPKPYSLAQLRARVQEVLDRQ